MDALGRDDRHYNISNVVIQDLQNRFLRLYNNPLFVSIKDLLNRFYIDSMATNLGITRSASSRCREGDGFDARPNPRQDVRSCTYCCYVRCATLIV